MGPCLFLNGDKATGEAPPSLMNMGRIIILTRLEVNWLALTRHLQIAMVLT